MDYKKIASELFDAQENVLQIDAITTAFPEMTVKDAYRIQLENVNRRKDRGEKVIGLKIGLTSLGMQKLLGVNEPDYGHLMDNMLLLEGEACPAKKLLQPKVEGELAFCMKKTLKGPGVTIVDVY
ncbi:MAG TPA: 2-keto-4-pentenoate hydratase, partial [Eubacteriaceae bacterium]|nr:2-keto-4-pentenoate hydratase [Eubacteriaceae bacterium]